MKKYTIDEIMRMTQQELSDIWEEEKKLIQEGKITESESALNVGFGDMTLEEVAQKYGLNDWEDVKNEIMTKLTNG